jgi:hypothetical protein
MGTSKLLKTLNCGVKRKIIFKFTTTCISLSISLLFVASASFIASTGTTRLSLIFTLLLEKVEASSARGNSESRIFFSQRLSRLKIDLSDPETTRTSASHLLEESICLQSFYRPCFCSISAFFILGLIQVDCSNTS